MFYAKTECPICRTGMVGFRKCGLTGPVVMMCPECDSVWLHPTLVTPENMVDAEPPDFVVESVGYSVASPSAWWADLAEIQGAGLESFVAGEGGDW